MKKASLDVWRWLRLISKIRVQALGAIASTHSTSRQETWVVVYTHTAAVHCVNTKTPPVFRPFSFSSLTGSWPASLWGCYGHITVLQFDKIFSNTPYSFTSGSLGIFRHIDDAVEWFYTFYVTIFEILEMKILESDFHLFLAASENKAALVVIKSIY